MPHRIEPYPGPQETWMTHEQWDACEQRLVVATARWEQEAAEYEALYGDEDDDNEDDQ